jgi:hypothetical protein
MKCFFCGEENEIVLENHHLVPRRLNKAVFSKNAAKPEKAMENRNIHAAGRVLAEDIKWICRELYEVI